jgi:hypothetical protein
MDNLLARKKLKRLDSTPGFSWAVKQKLFLNWLGLSLSFSHNKFIGHMQLS